MKLVCTNHAFEKMQRTHGLSMEAERTQSEQVQQKLKNDIAVLKEENEKRMEVTRLELYKYKYRKSKSSSK